MGKIVKIDPVHPDIGIIQSAVDVIKAGGMVIFPTRSLYGIAVDAFNTKAAGRIFETKNRSSGKAILVLIPSVSELKKLTVEIPRKADLLMKAFWPGNVTLIFKATHSIPGVITAGTGKIGIRLPAHPVGAGLVRFFGSAITGTSANVSGRPGVQSINQLPQELNNAADLILDAGPLQPGIGSTVVDVTTERASILREGTVSSAEINEILGSTAHQ